MGTYIHRFQTDSEYAEKRTNHYNEPWVSLTEHANGDVKSFVADTDPYDYGAHIEKSFGYLGVGNDVYPETEGRYFFTELPIYNSTISAVDTENSAITVDGMVFECDGNAPYSSGKYVWYASDEKRVVGEYAVDSIDGMVEIQGGTYSACTVDGKTYVMDWYDSDEGLYYWDCVNLETGEWLRFAFALDHENLVVGENVEIFEYLWELTLETSSDTPSVGDEVTYNFSYDYAILDSRNPLIGDVFDYGETPATVLSVDADPGEEINRVNYNKTEKEKEWEQLVKTPLTFEITGDGYLKTQALPDNLKYRKNDGEWINLYTDDSMNLAVVSGDTVQVIGFGNTVIAPRFGAGLTDCGFNLKGNIMSLCYGDAFAGAKKITEMPNYGFGQFGYVFQECVGLNDASKLVLPATTLGKWCYISMFEGCTSLTSAPELPATIMTDWCYENMFSDCTSLTTAPALPAETLADRCYKSMFESCTNLTSAPELPAMTLAQGCYQRMFYGCTSLIKAPELPVTALADGCYYGMFEGCTSLTTAPVLSATTLVVDCYNTMFNDCTSLTTAPALPATALTSGCYNSMFGGCTRLTSAPALPAEILAENCYNSMFRNCTSLTTAPALPATTLASNCYRSMFQDCTSLAQAPELPATTLANYCYSNMFYGCTGLTAAPALPAETLTNYCYQSMFQDCTSLTAAPALPAETLAGSCYYNMFQGCTSLTSAPALPATTLTSNCYRSMFQGCTSLTTAPVLSATTLARACYSNMFNGCTSLTQAPVLPATALTSDCYNTMFSGCTSLTTAPELPATTLADYCYYNMFNGCTNLNYIKCLATNISASSSHANWVSGVQTTSGTFVRASSLVRWPTGANGIPTNWTVQDA